MKKIVRNIVIVVLVLVVLVGAVGCLVVTEENEYTIVRQFGKVVDIRATAERVMQTLFQALAMRFAFSLQGIEE